MARRKYNHQRWIRFWNVGTYTNYSALPDYSINFTDYSINIQINEFEREFISQLGWAQERNNQ